MKLFSIIVFSAFFFLAGSAFSKNESYLVVKPKPGDGKEKILIRCCLPPTPENIKKFEELNPRKFNRKGELFLQYKYTLPVKKISYNGKSFKISTGIKDKKTIQVIQDYNRKLVDKGILNESYPVSGYIYIPIYLLADVNSPVETTNRIERVKPGKINKFRSVEDVFPIFGKKYEKVKVVDNTLEGMVYYLDSGHGGPDPGAISHLDGHELHEDEYAYDITLRLARRLIEHGGKVYIIVRDSTDGIRDDMYLKNNDNEYYLGNEPISDIQKVRLDKRAEIINKLYEENKNDAISQQLIVIHLDSRVTAQRIDIFFYNKPECQESREFAETLCNTIKNKYETKQPGRGYHGSVSPRSLLMLRETKPTSVYIELGNIQNPYDQRRFIQKDNRQAIANWLYLGLSNYAQKCR